MVYGSIRSSINYESNLLRFLAIESPRLAGALARGILASTSLVVSIKKFDVNGTFRCDPHISENFATNVNRLHIIYVPPKKTAVCAGRGSKIPSKIGKHQILIEGLSLSSISTKPKHVLIVRIVIPRRVDFTQD